MKVRQILEEYSSLELDSRLRDPRIKVLYAASMNFIPEFKERLLGWDDRIKGILFKNARLWAWGICRGVLDPTMENSYAMRLIRAQMIIQYFLLCFPKRGMIVDRTTFEGFLKKYEQQFDLLGERSGILGELGKGPGFRKFMEYIRGEQGLFLKQINMSISDELLGVFEHVGFVTGLREPGDTMMKKASGLIFRVPAFDYLGKEEVVEYRFVGMNKIILHEEVFHSNTDVHWKSLKPDDITCVVVADRYSIPFQICTFGVLVYGIYDLVRGEWLRNSGYEEFRKNI